MLETGDRSYHFIKREAVCMGGQLLYYTGVMKRLQEGSYEVDNGSGDAGTGEACGIALPCKGWTFAGRIRTK